MVKKWVAVLVFAAFVVFGGYLSAQSVKKVGTVDSWLAEDAACNPASSFGAIITADGNIRYCNSADNKIDLIAPVASTATGDIVYTTDIDTTAKLAGLIGVPSWNTTDELLMGDGRVFELTLSAHLAGQLTDETGTGLLVFGTAPTLSNVTITDGQITSTQAATARSFIFNNATEKTTGEMVEFRDAGSALIVIDGDGWLRTRTQRDGTYSVAGLSDWMVLGLRRTGKRHAVQAARHDVGTDQNSPYAVGIIHNDTVYCSADPNSGASGAFVCEKPLNVTGDASYGGDVSLTGGDFALYSASAISASGSGACPSGTALTAQVNTVSTVTAANANVLAPACDRGSTFVVSNQDSADALDICPPSGKTLGNGTDTKFNVPAGQFAQCWCVDTSDNRDCSLH